ncbi:retrovirus-related Pol polyprotein from type-1 retrotransposable element R2 [Clonorchis sinensis]|uniref:Retrovirus-related Pol polyprotein from type-1 retrotransposable element R2 n=1 Tax=Clonorchis sinensis TaxID=79923 RepID=G7YFP5_CLOSI|nr:retrovirus-related Pol polyprotein from type-1 retrotransposable element R2 [Clonorchis sinensis]
MVFLNRTCTKPTYVSPSTKLEVSRHILMRRTTLLLGSEEEHYNQDIRSGSTKSSVRTEFVSDKIPQQYRCQNSNHTVITGIKETRLSDRMTDQKLYLPEFSKRIFELYSDWLLMIIALGVRLVQSLSMLRCALYFSRSIATDQVNWPIHAAALPTLQHITKTEHSYIVCYVILSSNIGVKCHLCFTQELKQEATVVCSESLLHFLASRNQLASSGILQALHYPVFGGSPGTFVVADMVFLVAAVVTVFMNDPSRSTGGIIFSKPFIIIIIDSMTSVFNTDASLPYNHDLFESPIVKKKNKHGRGGDLLLSYYNHSEMRTEKIENLSALMCMGSTDQCISKKKLTCSVTCCHMLECYNDKNIVSGVKQFHEFVSPSTLTIHYPMTRKMRFDLTDFNRKIGNHSVWFQYAGYFDNIHYESSGASAPLPTSTQKKLLGLTCKECGKCCKSKAGLEAHHRVHNNERVGTNMVAQLARIDCSRLFSTKIDLSQHHRHAQPTQHNANKLGRVKNSGARSQQELQSLLRLANNLYPSCGTQTALFARLEQYFPGRSAISIKTRLRTLYHQIRKDAMCAVLDGSWNDLYKGNCGLPVDAEQYWKQVPSAPKHVDSQQSFIVVPSDGSLIQIVTGEEVGHKIRSIGTLSPGLNKLTLLRFSANTLTEYFDSLLSSGVVSHSCVVPVSSQFQRNKVALKKSLKLQRSSWDELDNYIRQSILDWLRLPKDNLISHIYAGKQHGRLGFPSLSATIPMQRRARMEKLLSTQRRVPRNVVNDSAFGRTVRDLNLLIRAHDACVNTNENLVVAWGNSLHNSADGRGLRELVAPPLSNRWLVIPGYLSVVSSSDATCSGRVTSARHGNGGQTIFL